MMNVMCGVESIPIYIYQNQTSAFSIKVLLFIAIDSLFKFSFNCIPLPFTHSFIHILCAPFFFFMYSECLEKWKLYWYGFFRWIIFFSQYFTKEKLQNGMHVEFFIHFSNYYFEKIPSEQAHTHRYKSTEHGEGIPSIREMLFPKSLYFPSCT